MLRFDRIQHLISPEDLRDRLVVQVGVGSGGAPANEHLTMNGIRRWVLFDPDTYDEINLVKHPRQRSEVGKLKVENQRSWILDRNPSAEVDAFAEDVLKSSRFRDTVNAAHLIMCCADTQEARLFVNTVAVELRRPCVTASVYRRGFGGEVYAYVPTISGCYDCMSRVAVEQGWNISESIELLPMEKDAIYGLNLRDFKASGLSLDIQTISIIQARTALELLLPNSRRAANSMRANWTIFYNRPIPGNPSSGFLKSVQLRVKARRDCPCGAS
jgi:molybdopterin/thiamine biosynthesis adenylyltransferase